MFAIFLFVVLLATLVTFVCCLAVFLQEAFAGATPRAKRFTATGANDRLLDRAPSSGAGALQPTAVATFSI